MSANEPSRRVTLRTIRKWVREGKPFAMLTCYDATTARWLWAGGVQTLLVGDTAAEMILGYDSTLPVKVEFLVTLTAAVRRGAPDAFIMADMPFGSYHCGDDEAMRHAVSFMQEGCADAVKLEVDAGHAALVERMSRAGVAVVAHVGSRPQQVRQRGYGSSGRSAAEADTIVAAARIMVERGASMLLLEAVPNEVSQRVIAAAKGADGRPAPVIGCGGGPACHGHVVVLHDLLGLTPWQPPFARPMADVGEQIRAAAAKWAALIASGEYLAADHPYHMDR